MPANSRWDLIRRLRVKSVRKKKKIKLTLLLLLILLLSNFSLLIRSWETFTYAGIRNQQE